MTSRLLASTLGILFFSALYSQSDQRYLGQKPPGREPEKFAPGLVSMPLEYEFGSTFSRDGKEFFYGVDVDGKAETRYMQLINGKWTQPRVILWHETFGYNDPILSTDGQKLYVISNRSETNEPGDYDIWYVQRLGDGWSEPINAGPTINTEASNEYYISFTNSGTMYFGSNRAAVSGNNNDFDIYRSEYKDGMFQKAESMPFNSKSYEADVFVSPDESYVIFAAEKPAGLGRGDLYISFQENDQWTTPKNMGEPINDLGHQLCPFVTYDGKYFFFTSNRDIYWVSAKILDQYK